MFSRLAGGEERERVAMPGGGEEVVRNRSFTISVQLYSDVGEHGVEKKVLDGRMMEKLCMYRMAWNIYENICVYKYLHKYLCLEIF